MSFKPYPKYKDSGVEWLGKFPEHWEVKRLRFAAEINPSKSEVSGLERSTLVSFLPMDSIGEDGTLKIELERSIGDLESGYTYFRDGDVTIAKITPCYENGKGAVMRGLLNGIGFGTTELIVVRPLKGVSTAHYLQYLFTSSSFRKIGESYMYGAGGQKRVPDYFVRDFSPALPPISEQIKVASFLDHETCKIDSLIKEQEKLIELLKEKRIAVISHAVTKGLNVNVKMKDSGVEWLGEVPEHWEIQRLSKHCSFESGMAHEPFMDEGGSFICVNSRFVSSGGESRKFCTENLSPAKRNDVLMVMSDLPNGRALAKAFFVNDDGPYAVNQRVCILTPKTAHPRFIFYFLDRNPGFLMHDDGMNQTHLWNDLFIKFTTLFPPLYEQGYIADYLDKKTTELDSLVIEAQKAINLLQERRSALISAAVTGQIDVRDFVSPKAA